MDAVLALLERLEMPFHIADALERNSPSSSFPATTLPWYKTEAVA